VQDNKRDNYDESDREEPVPSTGQDQETPAEPATDPDPLFGSDQPDPQFDNDQDDPRFDTDQPDPQFDTDQDDQPDQNEREITTASVIEAILFAADEPVTAIKLREIIGAGTTKQISEHIDQLNCKYRQMDCTFRIESIAGGYQMLTQPQFNPWLRKLIKVRSETKLSPAALETLAIIAYKQPIIRVDIESIRGVGAGEMVRQLAEKGLVKIVGRAEELGRPLLYGTTRKFLEVFGLNNLEDLPTAEDLKKPQ